MTINKVNLNKLQTYSGKTTQSFEQLIYSLMKKEYGHMGKFTPIAGAGGDSGIEFYLDLPGGERWGWQCKCYEDSGRLNQSGRYSSIENSLQTACVNHSNLTKWFLCLRTNLTVNVITKSGAKRKGEREWFEGTLPSKIPDQRSIQLEFIGEDEIIHLIGDIKNIGIRNFFFGEMEVNQDWFTRKFSDSFEKVKDKYEPELHTMNKYIQSIIDFKLLNPAYSALLKSTAKDLSSKADEVYAELKRFNEESTHNQEEMELKHQGQELFEEFEQHKLTAFNFLKEIENLVFEYDIEALTRIGFGSRQAIFYEYLERLSNYSYLGDETLHRFAKTTYYCIKNFFDELDVFIRNYIHTLDNEIHFIARPAEGKTHTSCDIAYKRIQNNLPAIFLTGDKFNHEINLEQAILKLLDIPATYSFEDLLTTLDLYGTILKVRIPIIIDGLNETVYNKTFSTIWRTHLPAITSKIKRFQNLAIITTCRLSYKDEVWADINRKSFQFLRGFDEYDITRVAIEKYFKRYHIKTDLNFSNLDGFKKPIFLRLYCEIKNPNWQSGNEVEVVIDDDSSNSLFETYFKQINDNVTLNSHLLRKNEKFIQSSLGKIAQYLWENNAREISVDEYYNLIDGTKNYNAETSKADILIKEGLIINRDNYNNKEVISITYELMSGYLIAKYLIDNLTEDEFLPQGTFHQKIGIEEEQHPLYENIIEELALLFPKYKQKMLHDLYSRIENNEIHSTSLNALWKMQTEYIRPTDIDLIRNYFRDTPKNRKHIMSMCLDTITSTNHPLNINFLSCELFSLNVWERDLSWTEYIRKSAHSLLNYVDNFERQCKTGILSSEISVAKLHLAAEYVHWFLVSTHRKLRDYSTRALYYYGRRYPQKLAEITLRSLRCNDPYLWERTLAASYGCCMALHHEKDFQQHCLPHLASSLYQSIFSEQAPFYTTHTLARDYARGCIRVALIHNPDLLSYEQLKRITPPYQLPDAEPAMVEENENLTYRPPLDMDFSNYTIGYIVKEGHSYSDPPEKRKVRRQILHRIEQFGWNEERFKVIDDTLSGNYNRYERPPVERYGKKYSRSAFFEIAGYRDDRGLLSKDFQHYRFSHTDLDPSFPEPVITEKFVASDLLGDRSLSLIEWLETEDFPDIGEYLESNLTTNQPFICMDGYIMQNDEQAYRERFTFIRGFLVKQDEYDDLLALITVQRLGGRWLPEKCENTDAYSGEYYLFEEATYSNKTSLEFILSSQEKIVRRGEEGYYPNFEMKKTKTGSFSFVNSYPSQRTITVHEKKEFEVLMPVMDYHSPSDNKEINKASSTTVLAKEIAIDLGLIERAQTFDLYDQTGDPASININHYLNSNNMHNMVYLRKDLLNRYLERNNMKFLWAVWGEREPSIEYRKTGDYGVGDKVQDYFVFQRIIEYQ